MMLRRRPRRFLSLLQRPRGALEQREGHDDGVVGRDEILTLPIDDRPHALL